MMMRGNNKQNVFLDDSDRYKFLVFLKSAIDKPLSISGRPASVCEVYAYALMGNHFHLLINVISGDIGDFIQRVISGYVGYFNKKYRRDGHLFKDRFKSEPCETMDYFHILLGYVHNNPIKHGFVTNLDDYHFTSWQEYTCPAKAEIKVSNVDYILGQMTLEQFKHRVLSAQPENVRCIDTDKSRGQISDESLRAYLKSEYGVDESSDIKTYSRKERLSILLGLLEYGGALRQIERITGVDKMVIFRLQARLNQQK